MKLKSMYNKILPDYNKRYIDKIERPVWDVVWIQIFYNTWKHIQLLK